MADNDKALKSAATRERIVAAALELFATEGYDGTTMRAIADRSGMSLGSAYYYFRSKDELIQGFYEQLFESFSTKAIPALDQSRAFNKRLEIALTTWVTNARPYHQFAGEFFRFAARPDSPLSPFSAESGPTREAAIGLYRHVIDGSRLKVPEPLNSQLPQLLWLYQMGTVLFWVYDDSEGQTKTLRLIQRTVPVVGRLLTLARLPGLKNIATDLSELFAELSSNSAPSPDNPHAESDH